MKNLAVIFCLLVTLKVWAIVPLEGIIYGDVRDIQIYDKYVGALSYQFESTQESQYDELKKLIGFKSMIEKGQDLNVFCAEFPKVKYIDSWRRDTAIRSVVGTLQYLGLDLSVKAIAEYAKKIEMNNQDYENLSENLVKNYCSENISVYSKKTLLQNLNYFYENDSGYELPSIQNSQYFSQNSKDRLNTLMATKRQLHYSILNLRALCSWGGDTGDYRLLVPYLKSPVLMSYVFDNILGRKLEFDIEKNQVFSTKSEDTVQVACENLICRRRTRDVFEKMFPRMIGSTRVEDDLNGLYCEEFSNARFIAINTSDQIRSLKKESSPFDTRLEVRNMISLISQVADPLNGMEKFAEIKTIMKKGIEERWSRWAEGRVKKVQITQLYEEPLEIELLSKKETVDIKKGNFNVQFRLSLSELDKVLDDVDKIDSFFNIKLKANYISYVKERISFYYNKGDLYNVSRIEEAFERKVLRLIEDKDKYFKFKIGRKEFASLLASELLDQFNNYLGSKLDRLSNEEIKIPVKFTYGMFALQYIHQKFIYQQNVRELLTFK